MELKVGCTVQQKRLVKIKQINRNNSNEEKRLRKQTAPVNFETTSKGQLNILGEWKMGGIGKIFKESMA